MPTMEELERRVVALEKANVTNTATMKWLAGTLGQIQATVEDHTERLVRIEEGIADIEKTVTFIKSDVAGLRRDLPDIITEAIRGKD